MLRITRLAALLAVCSAVVASPALAQGAASACPATFSVLHDDRIGALSLPAGPYEIVILNAERLSCANASDLFRQFLEDYNGRLPRPWALDTDTATFRRGSGSDVGFQVVQASQPSGGGSGGRHPSNGATCPSYFTVLHNDRIGRLSLPQGQYRITLLGVGRLRCGRAAHLFARFLQDFDGRLPRPWVLDVATATFLRGSTHVGFRVKSAVGPAPDPEGGGSHPAAGHRRCPGVFRVLHNDRIGALRLARGRYRITLLAGGGLSCSQASARFTSFLNDFTGDLPRPWVLNPTRATFTRGKGSSTGFRVKPAGRGR